MLVLANTVIALSTILLLGAVAGFTIYLGFPLVWFGRNGRTNAFLSALSVGVLLFLFVEMAYLLIEGIEQQIKLSAMGLAQAGKLWTLSAIFIGGFIFSLLGLVFYEVKFVRTPEDQPKIFSPKKLALLIALGIGLHNFSEGLVIGQEFIGGAIALGYTLVVGFALHNATEGFGIVAPMSGERPGLGFILLLGLIGGGPTFVGTLVGTVYHSEYLSFFFLALASGAILYIVGELIHIGKLKAQHVATTLGLLVGFFLAFGSDMVIERAHTLAAIRTTTQEVKVVMKDFTFEPTRITIPADRPTKLVLENIGTEDHEIEILGLPEELEAELAPNTQGALLIPALKPGTYPLVCDMPGHLMKGMKGELVVEATKVLP